MSAVSAKKISLPRVFSTSDETEQSVQMRAFAQRLTDEISDMAPEQSEKLLSLLISELALSVADQRRRNERRKHQRECVSAAKARGVQFGRKQTPLPDGFDEYYQAWKDGQLSLQRAAESCGMGRSSFRRAAMKREEQESPAAL